MNEVWMCTGTCGYPLEYVWDGCEKDLYPIKLGWCGHEEGVFRAEWREETA